MCSERAWSMCISVDEKTICVSIAQSKELRREAKLQRPGRCHV